VPHSFGKCIVTFNFETTKTVPYTISSTLLACCHPLLPLLGRVWHMELQAFNNTD